MWPFSRRILLPIARRPALTGRPAATSCVGGTDWEPYDDTVFVLPKTKGGVVINVGVRCVVMFCRVCGNARFHSTKVLERADV